MTEATFSYDRLAYSNTLFTQTFPDSFATIARLNGLRSPDVETARVLELGCGKGLNLISQAYSLPNAEFIGIDLAPKHIDYANRGVKELGLKNIEFRRIDVMEIDFEEFGKFDYIFAHGLFSWVPDFVRSKILHLYREMLTEHGLGYLSYNTYPGWHFKKVSSEILKIQTRDINDPVKKVKEARDFLKFLSGTLVEKDLYNFCLQNEQNSFENLPDTSIYHDALGEFNTPFYFHQFAAMLEENGLQFLSEVSLILRSSPKVSPEAKKVLEGINDIVWKEQYSDIFTGRTFRQTVFCHKNIELNRKPDPAVMDDFYVASALEAVSENPEYYSNKVEKFKNPSENEVQIDQPLVKTALRILNEIWGNPIKFSRLLEEAKSELSEHDHTADDWEKKLETTREIFLRFVDYSSLIEIHTYEQEINTEIFEKPKVSPLVRWQLNQSRTILVGYRRAIAIEDQVILDMLKLMDGSNTLEEVKERLDDFVDEDETIEDKKEYIANFSNTFDEYVHRFEKAGLFVK